MRVCKRVLKLTQARSTVKMYKNTGVRDPYGDNMSSVPDFGTEGEALTWLTLVSRPVGGYYHSIPMITNEDKLRDTLKSLFHVGNGSVTRTSAGGKPNELSAHTECRLRMRYSKVDQDAVIRTAEELYRYSRSAIYVQIKDGKVYAFQPFTNPDFRNSWGSQLVFNREASRSPSYAKYNNPANRKDSSKWWCNGHILCTESTMYNGVDHYWGDDGFLPLRHMLERMCEMHKVGDAHFFINKRDYPRLPLDPCRDPDYVVAGHTSTRDNALSAIDVAPVLSFYGSYEHADLCMPTVEDWALATRSYIPNSVMYKTVLHKELPAHVDWARKENVAMFRGALTGNYVDASRNQRLALCTIAKYQPRGCAVRIDAGITSVCDRMKVGEHSIVYSPHYKEIKLSPRIENAQWSKYKYLIYVDGHSAAQRLTMMLGSGSLVLKVKSICVAPLVWYHEQLVGYNCLEGSRDDVYRANYIEVSSDMSDLVHVLEWCHLNPEICMRIVKNARYLYDSIITPEGVTGYMANVVNAISSRTVA